ALDLLGSLADLLVAVRNADPAQRAHLRLDVFRVQRRFREPRIRGHVGFGHDIARIAQMDAMPLVRVASADPGEIRTGALAAPLERMVVHELACDRVVSVTLGLGPERPDHLRMAVVAAFAYIDVA